MSTALRWDNQYLKQWIQAAGEQSPVVVSGLNDEAATTCITQLASLAVCEQANPPCQTCSACRRVLKGMHPDVSILRTDRSTWSIKAIRELLDVLSRTPLGKRRLVAIHEAEKLSGPAANALLKALEEPIASTRFILLTQWPTRLLPTIRSRSQHLRAGITKTTAGPESESDELGQIANQLDQLLRRVGPTPSLRRAYQRLRDYYVIKSQRGNEKLAYDVLLLSLPKDGGIS